MMEFNGEFTVDGTPEELWKYFTDPDILMDCAPGCNKMVLESPSHIVAGLTVGVGSVKPSFDVEGIVTTCERPNRLGIEATGEASRNSFEATAWQELHDNGDGTTTVTWQAEAEVSGIIASLGERAIGSVADKLVNEFFQDLEDHVDAGTPAESQLRAASSEERDTAEELAADTADAEGDPAGTAVSKALEVTSGDGPSGGQSFAAGVVAGVLGSSVLRRLRDGGQRQVQPVETAEPAPTQRPPSRAGAASTGSGRSSLLVLGLTAALGAAGAVIWSQSQSDSGAQPTSAAPDTTADSVAPDASGDASPGAEPTQQQSATDDRERAEPARNGEVESDNPLDRLESRP